MGADALTPEFLPLVPRLLTNDSPTRHKCPLSERAPLGSRRHGRSGVRPHSPGRQSVGSDESICGATHLSVREDGQWPTAVERHVTGRTDGHDLDGRRASDHTV